MGTLQVGGTTLGVKNTGTNKVDLSNLGEVGSITGGNLGTITQRSTSNISGITFSESGGGTVNTTNLFGSTNVTIHGSSVIHAWLKFSYTTAVKINKLQWFQDDGAGSGNTENIHLSFEGSNVDSPNPGAGHTDWITLKSFQTPLANDEYLSYSGATNAIKYKHYRIRWGWASSGNFCRIHSFVLEDTDSTFDIKAPLNATGSAPIYACRAWVNFNGTGTVAIRNSGNVSSVGEEATGKYKINFTQSMPNTNYSGVVNNSEDTSSYGNYGAGSRGYLHNNPARNIDYCYVSTTVNSSTFTDFLTMDVLIIG